MANPTVDMSLWSRLSSNIKDRSSHFWHPTALPHHLSNAIYYSIYGSPHPLARLWWGHVVFQHSITTTAQFQHPTTHFDPFLTPGGVNTCTASRCRQLLLSQSVRAGLVIIHNITVTLSFLRVVLHPWVAPSPGQILWAPLPLRPIDILESPYLYPTSRIPIQNLHLQLLPSCRPFLRGVSVLPINQTTVSVLSTCAMSWAFMQMILSP
jgi:hypothetical protein